MNREPADIAAGIENRIDYIGVGCEGDFCSSRALPIQTCTRARINANFKYSLIFEFFKQRIAQVFEEKPFNQLVHGPAAAAVSQRDLRVTKLVLSSPCPLYSFKKRRWREYV